MRVREHVQAVMCIGKVGCMYLYRCVCKCVCAGKSVYICLYSCVYREGRVACAVCAPFTCVPPSPVAASEHVKGATIDDGCAMRDGAT
jgi:hypothetical protein